MCIYIKNGKITRNLTTSSLFLYFLSILLNYQRFAASRLITPTHRLALHVFIVEIIAHKNVSSISTRHSYSHCARLLSCRCLYIRICLILLQNSNRTTTKIHFYYYIVDSSMLLSNLQKTRENITINRNLCKVNSIKKNIAKDIYTEAKRTKVYRVHIYIVYKTIALHMQSLKFSQRRLF